MSTPTIALAIIAKNEVEEIERICKSYSDYFDSIRVLADDNLGGFQSLESVYDKLKVYQYKKCKEEIKTGLLHFDRKRTALEKLCPEDYYFRLDTDDEIINPENIKEIVTGMVGRKTSICYVNYDYAKDEWGNSNAIHPRETIIRNDGSAFWNKHIHENLLPSDTKNFSTEKTESVAINHLIDFEHSITSMKRNMKYLMAEYNADKENCDPRTIAYLAKSLLGLQQYDKAIYFFERHIKESGWADDRFFSWISLSDIYRLNEDYDGAIGAAMEALAEKPDFPSGYLKMGDVYFDQGKWKKAIEWTNNGMSKKIPQTMIVLNPTDYTWKPLLTLAMCYFQTSQFSLAYDYLLKAKEYVGEMDFVKENEKLFLEALYREKFTEHFSWLAKFYEDIDKSKLPDLLHSVPEALDDHELVIGLKNMYLEPKVWAKDEVCIFCSPASEPWSPASIDKGIGGSEEAVVQMAHEWKNLGYKVTVYNDCAEDEGMHDGVHYVSFEKFNKRDKFNVFIAWRRNFCFLVDAITKILWIHDLPRETDLNENMMRQTDYVVVLSDYHKSLLPDTVPESKIFVSTNGLVPADFDAIGDVERIPHRIIYASSYDRGLERILEGWGRVRKAVPNAELHIYYGWNTYDIYLKEGVITDDSWKKKMIGMMNQPGITEHGRIGHKELLTEYAKCGILAYPGEYTGEINCIALSKAIGCGCYPVTNDHAVLPERNTTGVVVPNEHFIEALISALDSYTPAERSDARDYVENLSWENVAKSWIDNVFENKHDVKLMNRIDFVYKNVIPGDKVVDIGCYDGAIFKDTPIVDDVTFVDLDDFGLKNYVKANAEDLPFRDKEFDVASMTEILEHIPNQITAIKEAMRVAKKIIITVPYEHEWCDDYVPFATVDGLEKATGRDRTRLLSPQYKDCKNLDKKDNLEHLWHIRWYTPETMAEDLRKAGCTDFTITVLRCDHWSHLGVVVNG